jgi:hypothetical protein
LLATWKKPYLPAASDESMALGHTTAGGRAVRLLRCGGYRGILRQIMVEGSFHADPHPGNVLMLRDGTPALIDFGPRDITPNSPPLLPVRTSR